MTLDELITHYPLLYHMAEEGSWPSISAQGLLTTRQMVDACGPPEAIRQAILSQRRPYSVTLQHPASGQVVVRDQGPLRQQFLDLCLRGMSTEEWLDVLNGRVFFWLRPEKLSQLLGARRYRNQAHDVLIVDTASLVAKYESSIRLSAINSGATLYPNAPIRGADTFRTIDDFPFKERRKGRTLSEAVVELAVVDGVPDIASHVVRVERRRRNEILEVLFSRD